jgi:tetratricopeptide (TPR) repeat protein
LLHQAKAKTDLEGFKLFEEAIAKFSFCLLLNPSYLGAAINGGVAYMDLARLIAVDSDDELYEQARIYFEKANAIHAGSASYNLACIYSLREDDEACLKALENAKNRGSLPDAEEIINDPDLDKVKKQPWFMTFMGTLYEKPEAVAAVSETTEPLVSEAQTEEPESENLDEPEISQV